MNRAIDINKLKAAIIKAMRSRLGKLYDLELVASAKGMYLPHTKEVCSLRRELFVLDDILTIINEVCGDE